MQSTIDELRTRLAQVSIDDLSAVHALYLDTKALKGATNRAARNFLDVTELERRVERAMGLAWRAAQERGEVRSKHNQSGVPATNYFKARGTVADICQLVDGIADEDFEKALVAARQRGNLTREVVVEELEPFRPVKQELVKPKGSTPRGRKTLEHMAIQIDAIALGVQDIHPDEVPAQQMADVVTKVFEDIGTIRSFLRKVNANAHN